MSNKWSEVDTKLCTTTPPYKVLFKEKHSTHDELFEVSDHNWCAACYNLYIELCSPIAKHLNISSDQKNHWDLEEYQIAIDKLIQSTRYMNSSVVVKKLEPILDDIFKCLQYRIKHNKTCYRPKKEIHPGNSIGDYKHDSFFISICKYALKLYRYYEYHNGKYHNGRCDKDIYPECGKIPLHMKYRVVINNCLNRIRTVCIEDHEEEDFYTYYNIDYDILSDPCIIDYYKKKNQNIKDQSEKIIKKKKSRKR